MISRLGLATRPGENIHKFGWHFTTLNGFVTSAAVAGRILGFGEEGCSTPWASATIRLAATGRPLRTAPTPSVSAPLRRQGRDIRRAAGKEGVTGARNIFEGANGFSRSTTTALLPRDAHGRAWRALGEPEHFNQALPLLPRRASDHRLRPEAEERVRRDAGQS
jgi:2-methylcitrate dehydratase PrpD